MDGKKVLNNLRFLTIVQSKLRTFDFRLAPNLEQLTLHSCHDLVGFQMPVESLKLEHLDLKLQIPYESLKLEHLNLSHSKLTNLHLWNTLNLKTLELKNWDTPNLKTLKHEVCRDLVEFKMPAKSLKLEHLHLSCSRLTNLHLGSTPNLKTRKLNKCHDLVLLPELGRVKCLKELNIEGTGIHSLPRSILQVKGLPIIGSTEILESRGLKSKIQTSYRESYAGIEGLAECKASASNLRRIQVKDIVKEVEDYL
ncbi:Toll/interleukin-1 receptor domain-containing protein [Tanacetum coccineum]